jgi:DNA processing protein
MAYGIDASAHKAALELDLPTVGVLPCGIDGIYPAHHRELARRILDKGGVVTEFPPGSGVRKWHFLKRNRIIAALSEATLVMEGKENSGSLITARLAKEAGKQIYAFPGNVGNDNSVATNLLIKGGAKLLTSSMDIIGDIPRLNPFAASDNGSDMNEVLTSLSVSAVSVDDGIFSHRKRFAKTEKKEEKQTTEKVENTVAENEEQIKRKLGDKLFGLYKKIPEHLYFLRKLLK